MAHRATRNDMMTMGREGVEPSRCRHRWILSPLRLPIPPSPQCDVRIFYLNLNCIPTLSNSFTLQRYLIAPSNP